MARTDNDTWDLASGWRNGDDVAAAGDSHQSENP